MHLPRSTQQDIKLCCRAILVRPISLLPLRISRRVNSNPQVRNALRNSKLNSTTVSKDSAFSSQTTPLPSEDSESLPDSLKLHCERHQMFCLYKQTFLLAFQNILNDIVLHHFVLNRSILTKCNCRIFQRNITVFPHIAEDNVASLDGECLILLIFVLLLRIPHL